ncbi:MAG: DUF4465 domain-containing protein [Alistipes sp.]|nr:DUF4465 domain-containing protein [Alistipes sp.]
MKKSLLFVLAATLFVACEMDNSTLSATDETLVVTGYCDVEGRTAFGTPSSSEIPFRWSAGDYIWLGNNKSSVLSEDCTLAQFSFKSGTAIVGTGHIFYNITSKAKTAKVLALQSADGNLGNDGDFGYATLDEYGSFYLEHKTAYIWFDTKSNDPTMPKLTSITLATEGVAIAGERIYNFLAQEWDSTTTNGSSEIMLNFEGGHALQSANNGVMAAMVILPAEVAGTKLTVTYNFEDESYFVEEKHPSKNFVSGATQRIATTISKSDLKKREPELGYELRVLTFEDGDAKFTPYNLDYADNYAGRDIAKWSDLIDNPQYSGPLMYGNNAMDAMYYWYDEGNTELYHMFPDNYAYCFWGGGHAISNYWGAGYADEDRNAHIAKYYGQDYVDQWAGKPGADGALGWFLLQLMIPVAPHSGDNFCVHYGYKDFYSYIENLPEWTFGDEVPRVIDHMYVTNTNYTLNQLYNGVKSEEGNSFGGNWSGLQEDAWLKIVAQGFTSVDDDEPATEAEFYLVNGLNVVEDWQKWDLSVLGKVAKVRFNFLYSEEMGGVYGFTIPGYFAYDDVAVRFEK